MRETLIEEEEVECRPVLDENVDRCLVRHYFNSDAWMIVQDVVDRKAEMDVWMCSVCQHNLHDGRQCIGIFHLMSSSCDQQ